MNETTSSEKTTWWKLIAFNSILEGDGFYISHLPQGRWNNEETAIVRGDDFFILYGDHRFDYEDLVPLGFDACYQYYEERRSNPL